MSRNASAVNNPEAFADIMKSAFQLNAVINDKEYAAQGEGFLSEYFAFRPTDFLLLLSLVEARKAISKTKARKAYGLADISARCLQHPRLCLSYTWRFFFKSMLRFYHCPTSWKAAKVILIP